MRTSTLKWCSFAAIAITFLALLPQLHLWHARGSEWNGAYATVDGDEFLYSAYINALIDERPRRNDPFSGRDDNPNAPLPESTFSIQFVPPFIIAGFARVFGLSASASFIFLIGLVGLLASVAVFFLFMSVTRDQRLAAVGTLFVLCFGGAAAGEGLLGVLINADVTSVGFPFLRRYQPAASFFLFFVFATLVWRALVVEKSRSARLYALIAGLTLGVLIFCYLYLWTAAAAWVVCVSLLWFFFRPSDRRRIIEVLATICGTSLFALIPYLYLLSQRARNLDETQTMISTRLPDPFRGPEIIGALVLVVLIVAVRGNRIKSNSPPILFAASLALLPFVLFNQQVVTGRSMQPFHFELFIANYAVLVSLILLVTVRSKPLSLRTLLLTAVLSLVWGVLEVELPAQARYTSDVVNDEMIPALQRLKHLSTEDGTLSALRGVGKTPGVVFSPDSDVMRLLPTWTAQGTLLGLGGLDFGSASRQDRKVYPYLYYSGADGSFLRELLHDKGMDGFMNYYARSALFGHERVLPKLSLHFDPVKDAEIENEIQHYENYVALFSREAVVRNPIAYVVIRRDSNFDFSRIDRWYERNAGEPAGVYDLFRVTLRSP
jgi:hypothetical protein